MPSYGSQGDEEAFDRIIRQYGPTVARYVRVRIPNPNDAEDVLQETFIAAWLGFRCLRNPARMQAWLMHVAQNRCRDYFRVRERREMPLDEETLQNHANRFGLHQYLQTKTVTDVIDALETAAPAAREAARRFYLEGLTIAEIAAASQSPPGTVKRQLFQARHAARSFLGVSSPKPPTQTEKILMTTQDAPPFPLARPVIRIIETDEPPFAVDCQELRSWAIIPRVGEQASFAEYLQPEWKRGEVTTMRTLRAAQVHNIDGVEIEVCCRKPDAGQPRLGTIYARLTDDKAEFLAVHLPQEESTQFETFLDDWFTANWGTLDRAISDQGILRRLPDGSLVLSDAVPRPQGMGIGFGVVRLEVGEKSFTCLRVLENPSEGVLPSSSDYYVNESYLTPQGRTVLVRRFCRDGFDKAAKFPVVVDESDRLVINGLAFVHWYDTLTDLAL